MAREVFGEKFFGGEERKIIEKIEKKRAGKPEPEEHDWLEDWEQQREGLKDLHDEAARKYKEALGVPPPEDWTAEEIVKVLDKEAEKENTERGWPVKWQIKRGHRRGVKSERTKGGETIRGQKAA